MKRWKNYIIGAAGFSFLLVAGSLLHAPYWVAKAAAAITGTPVADIITQHRIPYMQTLTENCGGFEDCRMSFDPPPTGYRLVIQNVSGQGHAKPAGGMPVVFLFPNLSPTPPVVIPATASPAGTVVFNQTVAAWFDGAPQLQWDAGDLVGNGFTSGTTVTVTLTGYLDDCAAYPGGVCPAIAH